MNDAGFPANGIPAGLGDVYAAGSRAHDPTAVPSRTPRQPGPQPPVTLRALLRERNVTRAVRNLGVTQPAVSASLSRLRRHFADELLVRVRSAYILTPLAAQLAGQVETVCAAAERLFATGRAFDPATTRREFTLLMADYPATGLGPALSRLFDHDALDAALHLQLVREALGSGAGDTIRLVDGLVIPPLGHFRTPGGGAALPRTGTNHLRIAVDRPGALGRGAPAEPRGAR
ncbi:LysR family transcriptional regulator [Streptomyces sp. NPDC005181]|uniref:LysR family transcriptional regulator n=1 Tax=Streptomyces sp. NPDC005181 TaxID=3156869 RepID=UPI0033A1A6FA